MVLVAIKLCLVYLLITWLDTYILSWQCLTRPIVVAPIAGLVMGDFTTGVLMGAALESVFMGISAIGGSIPADVTTGTIIAVAFTIMTDADMETAIALSLPIGTAMGSINSIFSPLWASLAPLNKKLATEGNIKKFEIYTHLINILMPMIPAIVMFFAVAFGVDGLNSLLAALPAWVMTGLGAASSMMLAVGFAILTAMIWSKEVGYFFFVGYVLVAYLHMDTLAIAIIGGALAATIFLQEKKTSDVDRKITSLVTEGNVKKDSTNDEEDFF